MSQQYPSYREPPKVRPAKKVAMQVYLFCFFWATFAWGAIYSVKGFIWYSQIPLALFWIASGAIYWWYLNADKKERIEYTAYLRYGAEQTALYQCTYIPPPLSPPEFGDTSGNN